MNTSRIGRLWSRLIEESMSEDSCAPGATIGCSPRRQLQVNSEGPLHTLTVTNEEREVKQVEPSVAMFDLDGTLAYPAWPQRGTIGDPIPEGVELLRSVADAGYYCAIFSARPEWDRKLIERWVKLHALPIDAIHLGKPLAGIYIDDKGWRPDYV